MLELLYLYRGFLGNRRDVSRGREGEGSVSLFREDYRVLVIFHEDIEYVGICSERGGGGRIGIGIAKESIDRFSGFLKERGFS